MKTFLMHPDRDFNPQAEPSETLSHFAQDMEVEVLLNAAAAGDRYLYDIMSAAIAGAWTSDLATISYRQDVLKDCLANPGVVRQFYALALEPFSRERSWSFGMYGREPSSMVSSAVRTLKNCLELLSRLKRICNTNSDSFVSQGFKLFFNTLDRNLDEEYLRAVNVDLKDLTFRNGILLSAELGEGGKGTHTMMREPQARDRSWIRRLLTRGPESFTLQLAPRDEAGARAFREIQNQGLGLISDALWQSAQHILHFFKALRVELAFYVGCLNVHERLEAVGESIAFPHALNGAESFECKDLRDICLALTMGRTVVGNDVNANGKYLVLITGANRGGKSTFLRSVGVAQLMMQCGMFVTAKSFSSSLRSGLFTHYKRNEDRTMRSGKFDEELVRMSAIADHIGRRAMVLFNESFAATNEREGSEIARQIVSALLENDVTIFFVSHMYELSRPFLANNQVMFLRADRGEDGQRTFRLREGEPLPKSFGADLYQQIFAPPS
ncbi:MULTISPECIES: MutS-related protein [Burkholderia cepacia complex]|jgi:hypothetical protein|uniref:DNA mismatch repair protein MutS n=1 Tax=Burkholderia vietnamiensis TaxID=60552 RepID=A0AAW7TDJ5_BURVI|nr:MULTISPECIES: DNA mismatch repair protein MutS [Burkholderia cepacia complex]MDN7799590.1 DNA mismatch repair protein MutS [Burkholderia vietnamiensis]